MLRHDECGHVDEPQSFLQLSDLLGLQRFNKLSMNAVLKQSLSYILGFQASCQTINELLVWRMNLYTPWNHPSSRASNRTKLSLGNMFRNTQFSQKAPKACLSSEKVCIRLWTVQVTSPGFVTGWARSGNWRTYQPVSQWLFGGSQVHSNIHISWSILLERDFCSLGTFAFTVVQC